MKKIPSVFYNQRKADINMLVIHSIAFGAQKAIEELNKIELSSHYFVDLDGTIIQCVDEDNRAFHASASSWRGAVEDINSSSIGIEVCNLSLGQTPYNDAQIEKLIHFCHKLIKKHQIKPEMIVAHSDLSPSRKPDPGLAFPWKRLSKEGIGLWYQPRNADKVAENDVSKLLQGIGYDTTNLASAQYAFCRRFLPEFVVVNENLSELLKNPYPQDFDISKNDKFLKTLKAVYYSYTQK